MKRNYDFSKGAIIKGQIKSHTQVKNAVEESEKVLTSIRLDSDIVEIAKPEWPPVECVVSWRADGAKGIYCASLHYGINP